MGRRDPTGTNLFYHKPVGFGNLISFLNFKLKTGIIVGAMAILEDIGFETSSNMSPQFLAFGFSTLVAFVAA